jgi:type IV pilus assembly protein PilF
MNKPVKCFIPVRVRTSLATAAVTVLLGACVHSSSTPGRESKPQSAAVYNTQLGIAYLNQGELALAKDKLDRALSQDPNSPDVHSARAMLFARLGNPKEADAEYRASLRLAPDDPNVINNYAVYLCQQGRTDEGVKRFEEAAKNALYRTPEAAYTNAGVCLHAAKRDDEARAKFVRALQLKPSFPDAALQLANLDFQRGNLTEARGLIDGYLNNFSENPDMLLLGVRVARAQKDTIAAQHYARKLQMNYPGTDQARALAALEHNPG